MSFFSAEDLSAGYGSKRVLNKVSFQMEPGWVLGVLGENGSGKTTLMKAICGILPHQGRCVLAKETLEELTPRKLARLCGYIPQRSGISIDLSVLDVALMGFNPWLGLLQRPTEEMRQKALWGIRQAGLAEREEENYQHLSEGQKQLCILARTLSAPASLLLLDEPESALDFRHRYKAMELLKAWVKEEQRGVIASLHDPSLALNYCDRLLVLREGRAASFLNPREDPLEEMEKALSAVYGTISLHQCRDRKGKVCLVMLKESQ